MPIILPAESPAYVYLKSERVFVSTAKEQTDFASKPLRIAILNLIPSNIESEVQLLRLLSNTPLSLDVALTRLNETCESNEIAEQYLNSDKECYEAASKAALIASQLSSLCRPFEQLKRDGLDGLVVIGTPNETIPFDQVSIWEELTSVMRFARENITSTLYICWAAQAALFYNYGIGKGQLKERLSGVYQHRLLIDDEPLAIGLDNQLFIPHSRSTGLDEHAVGQCSHVQVLAFGTKSRSSILKSRDGRMIFITGHLEYDEETLHKEYMRVTKRGLRVKKPSGYYCHGKPRSRWRSAATLVFTNWVTHYVAAQKS